MPINLILQMKGDIPTGLAPAHPPKLLNLQSAVESKVIVSSSTPALKEVSRTFASAWTHHRRIFIVAFSWCHMFGKQADPLLTSLSRQEDGPWHAWRWSTRMKGTYSCLFQHTINPWHPTLSLFIYTVSSLSPCTFQGTANYLLRYWRVWIWSIKQKLHQF